MGIPLNNGACASASLQMSEGGSTAPIYNFFTSASWIEGAALDQLEHLSHQGGIQQIASFPDLHPGKYGPVGCAVLADRIYPQFIGNDIGCGMSLFALDVPARKLRLDKVAEKLRSLDGPLQNADDQISTGMVLLDEHGLVGDLTSDDLFPDSIGTIGGGNHFCEIQAVSEVFDQTALQGSGLDKQQALMLVHSGSRALGLSVFSKVLDFFEDGLKPDTLELEDYLIEHDRAVKWASLNRFVIAQRAAKSLRANIRLISDAPHNLVERHGAGFLHRKGAAKADMSLVPIAGSRDALSFLVKPSDVQSLQKRSLYSIAHGSGRKYDRKSMKGRVEDTKSGLVKLARTSFGGHVVCEDKRLLVEEAPLAYKSSKAVLSELVTAELVEPVLSLKPLVTFKKIISSDNDRKRQTKHGKIKHPRKKRRDVS